ncbi:MAG: 2,4-dihydroxyhept-2-ene-1,7-dioic acid aldolase [Paracoccaceae bacterium]|nr:MAG: 2,4-dihydroxyhept-2-ene-1,7-dioic acid aldolase [Paracoccaceae bacterium]
MARARWDSLTIDMQHGTADYRDLLAILPVIERQGKAALVRVPWLDEGAVMRALDAGAVGVIAPMIETAAQAARLVAACRYPPEGARSFGPVRARFAWGDGYGGAANAEVLTIAMIETRGAVDALDEILAVPGLDGIYIGPADLSLAFGHPPGMDRTEPEMRSLIGRVLTATRSAGLRACIHCGSPDYAAEMAALGFDLVTIGSDARFIEAGAAAATERFLGLTA